jgi:hypothetical protein
VNKEVKKFVKELRKLGFEVRIDAHCQAWLGGKRVLTFPSSPSCSRWEKAARHDLRRTTGIVL